jgi:hypothetical protein
MGLYLRDEFADMVVKGRTDPEEIEQTVRKYMMYQDAMERVLGAPKGSIRFVTRGLIEEFFGASPGERSEP